jgi:hypothetical protein
MNNQINQAINILNNTSISFNERLNKIMTNGLVHEKLMRQYAVWCAKQVKDFMLSEKNIRALEKLETYVKQFDPNAAKLTDIAKSAEDLGDHCAGRVVCCAAQASAAEAACFAARESAQVAAYNAAYDEVSFVENEEQFNEVWNTTYNKMLNEAEKAQEQKLREMLIERLQ